MEICETFPEEMQPFLNGKRKEIFLFKRDRFHCSITSRDINYLQKIYPRIFFSIYLLIEK